MKLISFEKIQNSSKKNLFIIPFLFTFGNALCGFMSVIKTLDEEFMLAAFFILLAALMDLCDGRLARWFGSTSVLGMELDSLCDAISFCFAPAILLYSWSLYQLDTIGMLVLGLFLCAGLFRLARFNANSAAPSTSFIGLPTTFAAFFFANIIIYEKWLALSVFAGLLKPDRLAFLVVIIALLMISSIKFPSVKNIKLKITTILVLGLSTAMGAYAFIKGYPLFLAIAVTYIVASVAVALFKEIIRSWLKRNQSSH